MLTDYREEGRESKILTWQRNIDQLLPVCTLTGDGTCSLGMCPAQKSTQQPFGAQDNVQRLIKLSYDIPDFIVSKYCREYSYKPHSIPDLNGKKMIINS